MEMHQDVTNSLHSAPHCIFSANLHMTWPQFYPEWACNIVMCCCCCFFVNINSQINIFYIFLTDPSHIQTILAMSLTSWDTMKTRGMRRWIVNIPSMIIIKRKVFSLILDFWVPVCSLPWTAESVHFHMPTVSVIDFFFYRSLFNFFKVL